MGQCFTRFYLKTTLLGIVLSFTAHTGFGQIINLSPAEVKARTRKSQKEAARYQADHKETHLEIQNFNLKKGESGRKNRQVVEEPVQYVYDNEINAIYEETRDLGKRNKTRKSKKENSKVD